MWSTSRPGRLTPGSNPGTQCIGDWVGPRAGLNGFGEEENILLLSGFESRTVQAVASRYIDCAVLGLQLLSSPFLYLTFCLLLLGVKGLR